MEREKSFRVLFRNLIKMLSKEEIDNLCEVDDFFREICKYERAYIDREIASRVVDMYVRIESDLDVENLSEITHNVSISKERPVEMYGDDFQTRVFEILDSKAKDFYVVFHFTDNVADIIGLYTDKEEAERVYYEEVRERFNRIHRSLAEYTYTDDLIDVTYSDDSLIDRWRMVKVSLS